ncbi:Fructokinase [Mesoflavibacter sp. HG96]|uniref:carbohydrate kinase family protein n=1 Tax=unclassified Mesoflavibacter TaxID=2630131 RepID=UPI000D100496|nr:MULTISPECIES: carbohydrate kinase [unclassified Mesoflavibacter]QIJ88756.1 Fructokinase [Mesoflavibacter sp. HG96]QIJ91484.1 Fructokinase [Mesoflavibacter sp. HG37]
MKTFTCFGEVLWDVFPDHQIIGGAPLNVALRLKSFTKNVSIISAIGNDNLGEQLLTYLDSNDLTSKYIQTNNNYPTGQVLVTLDQNGSASYDIKNPSVWDFISTNQSNIDLVKTSDVFIYGSLVCRNSTSKNTLFTLLEHAKFKVFDVNLRAPYYEFETLFKLMDFADFIKFNDEELELISKEINTGFSTIEDNMKAISNTFNASHVCVTKGDKGAILLVNGKFYESKGYKVKVKDTVGAGDSFLATLIYQIQSFGNYEKAIDYACAIGALVAGSNGANPKLNQEEIDNLML